MCGNQSETSMPDWPCFLKVRFDASSLFLSTPRRVLTVPNDAGSFWPCSRVQFGLRVEGIDVARPAGHEQEDDALRLRLEVRLLRRERVDALGVGEQPLARRAARPARACRSRRRRCGGRRGRLTAISADGPSWNTAAVSRSVSADRVAVAGYRHSIQVHELVQVEQRPAQLAQRRRPAGTPRPRSCSVAVGARPSVSRYAQRRSAPSSVVASVVSRVGQRLRGGRSPRRAFSSASACGAVVLRLALRAAQVAVRQVERLQERVAQVAPGEEVDAAADVLRRVGA